MTHQGTTISCIIPAFNEERAIANTLRAVAGLGGALAEVIVVDDGSSDATPRIVQDFIVDFPAVKLIVQERNQGKSSAVARGVRESGGDFILLLDADLIGLAAGSIGALIAPVCEGEADVVISMRENTPLWMKIGGLDIMSGERVLPRSLFSSHLGELEKLSSFGLEVFLNKLVVKQMLRLRTVRLENVRNDFKHHKRGFWQGLRGELLMWRDIFRTVSLLEFVVQIVRMRKLLV